MRGRAIAVLFCLGLLGAMLIGCGGGGAPDTPVLREIAATCGPCAGGTDLTLKGSGFTIDAVVLIGGQPATDVAFVSESTLVCVTPPGIAGAFVDVAVTTTAGTAVLRDAFRYFPVPVLSAVVPGGGPLAGETTLLLAGSGLEVEILGVTVGGREARQVTPIDDSSCSCVAPPGEHAASVEVVVTTAGGVATLEDAFYYFPEPTLDAVEPDSGFTAGGEALILSGAGFLDHDPGLPAVRVGGSLATDVRVLSDTRISCTAPPGVLGSAHVTVSNRNGTAVLVGGYSYFDLPPTVLDNDLRLDTDEPGAAESNGVRIHCDGKKIYAVWHDFRNGESDIYFNRSLNGGLNWLSSDMRLDSGNAGAAASCDPQIVSSGADLFVVWHDNRNGGQDIYFNRSTDGGATWLSADVRVNPDTAGDAFSLGARLCAAGDDLYVVWEDNRSGGTGIYFNRSTDGGVTWLSKDLRLDTPAFGLGAGAPRIGCAGSNVYVVWEDLRDGDLDIRFNRSTDGGASWLESDLRLDTDGAGASYSGAPDLCCSGDSVYVVWEDLRSGSQDLRFNRSTDAGASWLTSDLRLDTDPSGAADSYGARICSDGQNVFVAWEDSRSGRPDIRFTRSTDGGATWLSSDLRLDTDTEGASDSFGARIACDGDSVCVAWSDWRNGAQPDIYLNRSKDAGASWLSEDVRLDTDDAGTGYSADPQIGCAGARLYAVWYDYRDGAGDVRFNCNLP